MGLLADCLLNEMFSWNPLVFSPDLMVARCSEFNWYLLCIEYVPFNFVKQHVIQHVYRMVYMKNTLSTVAVINFCNLSNHPSLCHSISLPHAHTHTYTHSCLRTCVCTCVFLELEVAGSRCAILGRLRFHDDNENDNEISLSFSLRFCRQRDERPIAPISSTTMIPNRNPGRTQEMMMSAHTNFVLVLIVVVVVKS